MAINFKLEKFSEKDFPAYFELVADSKVMEMITERPLEMQEAKRDFAQILANNKLAEDFGNFKILQQDTDAFIGLAKLEIQQADSTQAELGYMLLPKYWGKGIAGKVSKKLIEIARQHPSIGEVFAIIDPKNLASRKILTNNGFISKEFKDFDGLPGEVLTLKCSNA